MLQVELAELSEAGYDLDLAGFDADASLISWPVKKRPPRARQTKMRCRSPAAPYFEGGRRLDLWRAPGDMRGFDRRRYLRVCTW